MKENKLYGLAKLIIREFAARQTFELTLDEIDTLLTRTVPFPHTTLVLLRRI